jgi:ABC-type multidrug transport system ATPase subunit
MNAYTSAAIELDDGHFRSPAIELRGLTKTYQPQASGPVHALTHVTMSVRAGEAVGLLGPNAAGKTTLVKLIAGMERPTAGQVRLRGHDVAHERELTLMQIGVALESGPQRRSQYSAWQLLLHWASGWNSEDWT